MKSGPDSWLASILWQRMDQLAMEASNREVAQVSWPGVTTHQAGRLFGAGIMCSTYHLADSDLMMLQFETAPEDVEEVSIDLLD